MGLSQLGQVLGNLSTSRGKCPPFSLFFSTSSQVEVLSPREPLVVMAKRQEVPQSVPLHRMG